MKRGIVIATSLIFVVTVLVFAFSKYQSKRQDYEKYKTLPAFVFKTLYNQTQSTSDLPKYKGYVIQVFYPGCEVCQEEAADYYTHNGLLQNILFLMLSPDSIEKVKDFALKQKLYNIDNFIFGHVDTEVFERHFGLVPIPSIFIYDSEKELISKTRVVNPSTLLNYFKN